MSFGDCLVKSGLDPSDPLFGTCSAGSARDKTKLIEGLNLIAALNRAVNYAHDKGVLLVASAGNKSVHKNDQGHLVAIDAIDWDRRICETTDAASDISIFNCPQGKIPSTMTMVNMMKIPAQLPHVVAVSATGPQFGNSADAMGVGAMGNTLEVYTDHGMSIITFAAPGGSVTPFRCLPVFKDPKDPKSPMVACNPLPPLPDGSPDPRGMPADQILSACARFTPGVNCTSGRANRFMVGTSMAAAHVSGVAALIDSAAGGALTGDQIMEILMQSADDLGKPGKDSWYGFGRIDADRAVTGK